jgi:hypothetical protein
MDWQCKLYSCQRSWISSNSVLPFRMVPLKIGHGVCDPVRVGGHPFRKDISGSILILRSFERECFRNDPLQRILAN